MVEDGLEEPPPVNYTGVVSPPYNFEDRFEVVELGLKRLRVLVPERHDLAPMKTARGEDHDVAALLAMHRQKKFKLQTLVERYEETLSVFVGSPWRLRENFIVLVAALFSEKVAAELEKHLKR
jgi:hypothetical protein